MAIIVKCVKCGRTLGGNHGDNQRAGVCYYCLQKKRCVRCGKTLVGGREVNAAVGLCDWCRRHNK